MVRLLTEDEITGQLAGLKTWRRVSGAPEISASYTWADFAAAMAFVNRVADEAEQMDHHPDIDIRWNQVTLVLATHSAGGLTQLDFELAHRLEALAPRP